MGAGISQKEASPSCFYYDPPGVVRVFVPWPTFGQMVHTAFDQIRLYAQSDAPVSLRLLRALQDIASATPDCAVRRDIYDRAKSIVEGCAKALTDDDVRPMRVRLAGFEKLLAEAGGTSPAAPR